LIAGGWFTSSGNDIISAVARWDGTKWTAMSTGMNGTVYAFCNYRGELYAAGNFNFASGIPAGGIAKWDGYKWNPVGTGVAGGEKTIYSLAVYNDELYAGGSYIKMGDDFCYNIAKYNGISWRPIGAGADGAFCNTSRGYISSMKVCNDELYIAGHFSKINGVIANKLARFNGANWCSVEYGVDLRPRALEVFDNDLIINGDFYSASGVESNNIVRYSPQRNLTGIENNNTPLGFKLEQNYPNPFNPKTKIGFSIANPGYVSLKIFDITGKQVAVLADKDMQAGYYNFDFDGQDLGSGVYIYRLEASGRDGIKNTESKKMILIK
ncbi:MAG TPA: T9SS type A sorting domain-containing protein, partial [Ignavibacteria bacterium]|nr:T9SS type A sorting domain-containing protein [Ignavibacteria bacterium]